MTVWTLLLVLFVALLVAIVWISADRFPHVRRQPARRSAMERRVAMARRERARRERARAAEAAPPEWDTADNLPVVEDPAA